MAKIIETGDGSFVDTEPVAAPEGMEDNPDVLIYAYAKFRSLEHVSFGLFRTDGTPTDEEIDSQKVGEYGMEPIAPFWEFADAIRELKRERGAGSRNRRWIFEEVPLVEVTDEEDYATALEALGLNRDPDDPDDSEWKRSGLYDFRDDPPSFHGSVEAYELEEMKDAADQAFEFMFQGEEWEAVYEELAEAEEEDEED